MFKYQSTNHFKEVGKPTGSVQGFQPESPAQPQLLQGFLPSRPIFCKASFTFLAARWSLEHFTWPYKSASSKSAAPFGAPKPPVRVEQEETPAVLLPATRRDVQYHKWQGWAAVDGEGEWMLRGRQVKGKGEEGKERKE